MIQFLCGIDEAGRGPLAGPVYAAAVILGDDFPVEILDDSKKLSEKKRLAAEKLIKERALAWGIGFATHEEIDSINILQASLTAMARAFENMTQKMSADALSGISCIVDGTFCPEVPVPCRCEPKADGNYPCVMAASILAKNERDRVMCEYDALYPQYGYKKHKGYPTKAHKEACREFGPSPIQRLSFKI